jgi:uncharacterized protein YjiS (DUF1127 family)
MRVADVRDSACINIRRMIAMSLSVQTKERPVFARWLARKWGEWQRRRRTIAEIDCCDYDGVERLAHDVGLSRAEFCILAGKWPDSLDLLSRRLEQVTLDARDIAQAEPYVLRDLQRVCSLCASKRRCERGFAGKSSDPVWQEYCPNAPTLHALIAERCNQNQRKAS